MKHKILASALLLSVIGTPVWAAPYQLPGAEVRTITARDTGDNFTLFIFKPDAPPPHQGYPIIYILDGNSVFGAMTDEVRRKIADNYGDPAMVVAIGYPGNEPWHPRREKDLTPWALGDQSPLDPDGNEVILPGGGKQFLDFIQARIIPEVEKDYPVNSRRRTLAGHSFGGLFTLHAFLIRSDHFQSYVAMSPSIWFAQEQLIVEANAYISSLETAADSARLLITVGGCEETPGECDSAQRSTPERDEWLQNVGMMVTNAGMFAQLLQSARGDGVSLKILEGEHHTSTIGAALARVSAFAMRSPNASILAQDP